MRKARNELLSNLYFGFIHNKIIISPQQTPFKEPQRGKIIYIRKPALPARPVARYLETGRVALNGTGRLLPEVRLCFI